LGPAGDMVVNINTMERSKYSMDNRKQPSSTTPNTEVKLIPVNDQCYDVYLNNNISKCTQQVNNEEEAELKLPIPPSTALTIEKNPLNDLHKAILKERAAKR
jgi:hypothetical protein